MDPKAYAIHKRLREQTGHRFQPTPSRQHKGPEEMTIPLIRPPENCENRKRHVVAYDPLPTPTSIRMLQVHPEEFENEFDFYSTPRCSLVVKDLDDDPVYDALSYPWGCPVTVYSDESEVSSAAAWAAPSFDIICDGKPFSVTANLYAAILSLRLQFSKTGRRYGQSVEGMEASNMPPDIVPSTRHIWIDQICINQSDLQERNSQVMLMGRIFKQSRLCLVWLGGDDRFSQTVLDPMVKVLNTSVATLSKLKRLSIFEAGFYKGVGGGMEPIKPWEWITLYAFLSRSWFCRSWVVQEAALPRQLSFVCGLKTLAFDHISHLNHLLMQSECLADMMVLAEALQGRPNTFTKLAEAMKAKDPGARIYQPNSDDGPARSILTTLSMIRIQAFGFQSFVFKTAKAWKPDHHGLSNVLSLFRDTRATDPRDKVYAFLGLAEELGQTGTLRPAYEKPITEAFRDAIKFMLQSSNSLNVLALREDPQRTKTPGLESWVPDFASDSLALRRVHPVLSIWSQVKHPGATHFKFHLGGALEVRGLRIGTACVVHELAGLLSAGVHNGPSSLMSLFQALPEYSSVWVPPLTPSLRSYLERNELIPNEEIYGQAPIRDRGTVARQSRTDVFWRTLLTNKFGKEFPPSKSTGDVFLQFWDRGLQGQMVIAGLHSDPTLRKWQRPGLFKRFGGSCPSWDILKSSISNDYSTQMILKGQHGHDAQVELFPEEMSSILPELDAAWAEGRTCDEGTAMANVAIKKLLEPLSAEVNKINNLVHIGCANRSLFATREGQLGNGPKSTREGDEIWNLVGADAPFVLRPRGDGRYTLLGEAYVHGAMFAEWHEGDFDAVAKDIKTISII